MTLPPLSRRSFTAAAFIGTASLLGTRELRAAMAQAYPFTLGVASGDPRPDGVVLWTRLAPDPLASHGGMDPVAVPVRWEISADESFRAPRSGTIVAEPAWGHSVHAEIEGLAPDRTYFYRFIAGGVASPVGRTRTAPAADAMPGRLRIAFASCQHYEAGHYAAYRHMVADEPDLIIFLGDYIYEGKPGDRGVRRHQNAEPRDLAGYRARYATYKGDPLLQAAHHAAPWVMTWDDHEVEDNYGGDSNKFQHDPAAFLARRAAAYQAYFEHMPLRRAATPKGAAMRLYRTVDWGRLAQFQVIDDRQYRDLPPCQPADLIANRKPTVGLIRDCPERHRADRSLLGQAQERWLLDRLQDTRARWNLLSQQTLMKSQLRIPFDDAEQGPSVYNSDSWDGYTAARDRVLRRWRDAGTPNPIVLSGDIHSFVAGDHFDPDKHDRIIASEFVGGSLTSGARDTMLKQNAANNPGFHFAENQVRGYARMDLTPGRCDVAFRGLSEVRDPLSAASDIARFTVENGQAGMKLG
ncbi:alkaline phosphatase D family protein [Sphingomonas sp. M1-B02]|uniref:alkaline phosphatase D family protein n=1 Tax=Sphingomonas sp. M1-B02 TaxID=3114300 RepID=UPI0022409C85|nr:alkaline phosphatase D family protein [Sphingomonas sp. S6-11]UZK67682.1 alkaline phosphatase D family protein [Sphingomonas sp. S6-11]